VWAIASRYLKLEFPRKAALATVVGTFAVFLFWLFSLPYPLTDYLSSTSFESVELALTSVASLFAIFTFSWIFIVFALIKLKGHAFEKLWLFFSFAFLIIGFRLGIFMSMPAALFAGWGINFAWQKAKPYSKAFVIILLLLAAITVMPKIAQQGLYVHKSERSAMVWIEGSTPLDATLAAQWDRGHPLTYYAKRKVVLDGYFEFAPGLEERNASIKNLMTTSDCEKIAENASQFGADYIFIHKRALNDRAYRNGLLEATACPQLS
jgi:asparagine N-glycosylation enzyme membrane subunit Stt3